MTEYQPKIVISMTIDNQEYTVPSGLPDSKTTEAEQLSSYAYTGKHDHGELPKCTPGFYHELVQELKEAKRRTDAIIAPIARGEGSDEVENEYQEESEDILETSSDSPSIQQTDAKKPRVA